MGSGVADNTVPSLAGSAWTLCLQMVLLFWRGQICLDPRSHSQGEKEDRKQGILPSDNQVWWLMPIILELEAGGLGQKDYC